VQRRLLLVARRTATLVRLTGAPLIIFASSLNGMTITSVTVDGGNVTDPSGYGEGKTFVGSTDTDGFGTWSITFTGANGCFTAFYTATSAFVKASSSSEFSANTCRMSLPKVAR
jgi:hypothetical protein